ncbi:MAG: hypothetical protein P1Q69_15525, partial [Candidatus Thorarchaeota archaeon]|nr:hypothetical protein [Candidatus Thorarchaeota archaeon]
AYQSLIGIKKKARWIELWSDIQPLKILPNMDYTYPKDIRHICTIGGSDQLDKIIQHLVANEQYGLEMDLEYYVTFLEKRQQDIEVKLTSSEVKILELVLMKQTSSSKELADEMNLSKSWVSEQVSSLREKQVLYPLMKVPFSRVGIRMFYLFKSDSPDTDQLHSVRDCPFLFSVREVLLGPWNTMVTLAVPDNAKSIRSVNEFQKILDETGMGSKLIEINSSGLAHSFRHYDAEQGGWSIPWNALHGWGHRILNEGLQDAFERIDIPAKRTESYLDDNDMHLLSLVLKGTTATREQREHLGIGQKRFLSKRKQLEKEGLIQPVWNIHNVGLSEHTTLWTDKNHARTVEIWARELPRTFIRYDKRSNLMLEVNLPRNGAIDLLKCIHNLEWHTHIDVSVLNTSLWGNWDLPKHLWNIERQSWDFPESSVAIWLDGLHISQYEQRISG